MSKKNNNKPAAEAVEFLPDAIEIKNERLPWPARFSLIFSLIFFLGAILWASLGKVDVVVKANGKIISTKTPRVVKPMERLFIKKIHIKVGDIVEPGQILVTFDPTIYEADCKRLKREVEVLSAKEARLSAEFHNTEYAPKTGSSIELEQKDIFMRRANYYSSKMHYYEQSLKQMDASRKSKEDSIVNQEHQLATMNQIETMYRNLEKKKAAALKELLEVQLNRIQVEQSLDTLKNALPELAYTREGIVSERDSFIHDWRNNIIEELVSTRRELSKTNNEYVQAKRMEEYIELRSDVRAMVHEVAAFSEGSAVREAEAMLTLIPIDGGLEIEAQIEPKDIGRVLIDSDVRIKLNSWSFQKYGTISGKVRNLSEDTLQRSSSTASASLEQSEGGRSNSYYRAQISMDDMSNLRNLPKRFRLIPGMEVEVEIKTGRRRIIEYIIYPLIKALDETAREP